MTASERVRARKAAARKERIRQEKAVRWAKPGGLAGMGVSAGDLAKQALEPNGGLLQAVEGQLANNPERSDVAGFMGEVPNE